jgi:hypothetical protein
MSYTNPDLVKSHIRLGDMEISSNRDYPLILTGTEWADLPGEAIKEAGVVVKAAICVEPYYERIILADVPIVLAGGPAVPQSVAVASDSSLGRIYEENVDYMIDLSGCTILRLTDGAIAPGSALSIWYFPYQTYTENQDYQVDYLNGRLRRLSGSAINSGQRVLVDYDLSPSAREDSIIAAAVSHANGMVEAQVDPAGKFGASPILQSAATFLAVSLVCRMAAAIDLGSGFTTRQNAPAWLSLAESYRRDFNELIKNFHPDSGRPKPPVLT